MIWVVFSLITDTHLINFINAMKVKYLNIMIGLAIAAVSWSCSPDALQDLTPEDSQVFITNYEKSVNFGNFNTFSLADSVFVLQNDRS